MMQVLGVIPARYGSTRFPGKPLHPIAGVPLLQRVIEGCKDSRLMNHLMVATDDERIMDLCQRIEVDCVMTASELPSGSDRVWAAAQTRSEEIVLNIQGDEPLIQGWVIDRLIEPLKPSTSSHQMSTLGRRLHPQDLESINTAKIVVDQYDQALYFSRFAIPHSRQGLDLAEPAALKHIGIYGYRRDFLGRFCDCGPVALERAEGLEQLRALYLGAKIKVVTVDHGSWGVDCPEDVAKIEALLKARNTHGT